MTISAKPIIKEQLPALATNCLKDSVDAPKTMHVSGIYLLAFFILLYFYCKNTNYICAEQKKVVPLHRNFAK